MYQQKQDYKNKVKISIKLEWSIEDNNTFLYSMVEHMVIAMRDCYVAFVLF